MRRHALGLALCLSPAAAVTLVSLLASAPAEAQTGAKDGGTATAATAPRGSATPITAATSVMTSAPVAARDGGVAPPGSGPAIPIPDKPAMDGATYSVRLRDLEARVDELKDQIRRSHTRLALLSDTILSGGAAGSRAEVLFKNEMSSAFKLTRALFVVDGAVQYNRTDESGALADQKEIPIFQGSMPPGDHTVQVVLNFQGNGYGVFTYLRGYKFEVKSAHSFTAVEGKTLGLIATALEKGGVTTPLEQRPTIEWQEKIASLGPGGSGGGGSGAAPSSSPAATAPGAKASGTTTPGSASGSISVGK